MEQGFHFIRPLWLLLAPMGPLLLWWWNRRNDPLQRWKGMIAPHLLKHLVVGDHGRWRTRPIHLVCAVLVLGAIACAGPTWELDPPPFAEDRAPMVVALDLSPAMNAIDVAPTRLERAKQKIRDLVALRAGGRIGLIVYTNTAHMVLPPTDDPALMELFLSAITTDLLPARGQNAAAALAMADHLLDAESDPGTVVFFTSGFDDTQIAAFVQHHQHSRQQVLMLAVGTTKGGPLRAPSGALVTGAEGGPVQARLDDAALERLSSQAHVPLASITTDDADMRWVQREALHHLAIVHDSTATIRWKEYGYYLCYPLVLLALLWFRRGWMVRWVFVLGALGLGAMPAPASAADRHVADWFFTPDQQGRWYYEHRDFGRAAEHFQDPYWKGLALYQHGRYDDARKIFETLPGADAQFMTGNCYARRMEYQEAKDAYNQALRTRHPFPQAQDNLALMTRLIKQREEVPPETPDEELKPDEVKFDKEGKKGNATEKMMGPRPSELPADVWMRNLNVSPADFLRTKFNVESETPARTAAPAAASTAPAPPAQAHP
ncbi:VWA domain-containing protein [Dyella solisilvae]|uniref:VWA domain-containing protein n=1 Tax=Dyella solisilvae TaxID=1920168 RepID=A0A370K4L4_9GAMM|nr:VWA domain-containing protein [Dyella solisilvae]RDI97589.1 VWA domain-containing protein [Dyella solisilvae]